MDDVCPGREACGSSGRTSSVTLRAARRSSCELASRALVAYAATFGFGDDDQLASDLAEEDYVARYAVVVCDRPPTAADDGAELLADYRDDGGGYRWVPCSPAGAMPRIDPPAGGHVVRPSSGQENADSHRADEAVPQEEPLGRPPQHRRGRLGPAYPGLWTKAEG